MASIEASGGRLEVFSTGDGPDLVLLHSLLIDSSAFDAVVPRLATFRRVHVVALPAESKRRYRQAAASRRGHRAAPQERPR